MIFLNSIIDLGKTTIEATWLEGDTLYGVAFDKPGKPSIMYNVHTASLSRPGKHYLGRGKFLDALNSKEMKLSDFGRWFNFNMRNPAFARVISDSPQFLGIRQCKDWHQLDFQRKNRLFQALFYVENPEDEYTMREDGMFRDWFVANQSLLGISVNGTRKGSMILSPGPIMSISYSGEHVLNMLCDRKLSNQDIAKVITKLGYSTDEANHTQKSIVPHFGHGVTIYLNDNIVSVEEWLGHLNLLDPNPWKIQK